MALTLVPGGGLPRKGESADFESQGGVAKQVKDGVQFSTRMGDRRESRVCYP